MINKTVIISCAGQGTRLGKGIPKCLVEIEGKSLIEIQLEELKNVSDIRVVVGFKKEMVIDKLKKLNFQGKIIENENYLNTGTAGSFCCAIDDTVEDYVIALDGDLIVSPEDMQNILETDEEIICGEKVNTEGPVLVTINENNEVIKFSREEGQYEWAGLAQIRKENINYGDKHVYQLLESNLPIKFQLIRAKEIDTPNDLDQAKEWIKENFCDKKKIVDEWFKSRFNIENNYVVSRYRENNRIDYDIDLISKYVDSDSRVLDLGCGTGIIEEKLSKMVKYIKAIDKYQEFLEKAYTMNNVEYEKNNIVDVKEDTIYDAILMFGVTMYILDEELDSIIKNCIQMMNNSSVLIIKNQWSTMDDDLIINKQFSIDNDTQYYAVYRSLLKMKKLLIENGFKFEIIDLYPAELNLYDNTHEYALVCRKVN